MELEQTKIIKGRWAYAPLDQEWPDRLRVYTGAWENRAVVGYITKYQAMAYYRHWQNGGVYYSVKDGNGRWKNILLIGDVAAFYGEE